MNKAIAWIGIVLVWLLASAAAQAGTRHYYYTDPQGTVLATADEAGNIVETADYRPYGARALGAAKDGLGYTGHVNDADSGFVYMQRRYYDPQLSMFLSVDPVMAYQKPATNFCRYCYARNNPYKFTDPYGRDSVGEIIDQNAMASAASGNDPATYGWAFAATAWVFFGAEGVSQLYDKGTSAGAGNGTMAVLEVATLGKGKLLGEVGGALWKNFEAGCV